MKYYVGLDVSLKETAVCVIDEEGSRIWQGKCASTPQDMEALIRKRAPHAVRIACLWQLNLGSSANLMMFRQPGRAHYT